MKSIRAMILNFLHAIDINEHERKMMADAAIAWNSGYTQGAAQAKIKFAIFPMPFDAETLRGVHYGTFITPVGFGAAFGECNIPAPNGNGYEQRAYYVAKNDLYKTGGDLHCQAITKFDKPEESTELVPVIVTVLR